MTAIALPVVRMFVASALPIRRALIGQRDAIAGHERRLRAQSDHHRLVGRLQNAFDMAESDQDAFKVVGDSLAAVVEAPAELLVADSGRAHLRRVATSRSAGRPRGRAQQCTVRAGHRARYADGCAARRGQGR